MLLGQQNCTTASPKERKKRQLRKEVKTLGSDRKTIKKW